MNGAITLDLQSHPNASAAAPGDPALGARYRLICLILALIGGFADAGSYVMVGSFTGHVTGNTVLAMIALAEAHWTQALSSGLAVLAFMAGTTIGALWDHATKLGPCRRLVQPLLAEMALIAVGIGATRLPPGALGQDLFLACLCVALGVQNGILGKVGSVSVHSTFITGMSTSLATSLAGGRPDGKRRLLAPVIGCFVIGALCGAWLAAWAGVAGLAGILAPLVVAWLLAVTAPQALLPA
jgi:uncharacterized membrane protein YoaK (UPF0700 family)